MKCLEDVSFEIADAPSCRLRIRAAKYPAWVPPAPKKMYFPIVWAWTTHAPSFGELLGLVHDFRRGIGHMLSLSLPEVHPAH